MSSGSEPDRYTVPSHVPATDLTSDTATGVSGARLAQPTSEAAIPTTMVVKTVQSDRAPLGVIVSLLFFEGATVDLFKLLLAFELRGPRPLYGFQQRERAMEPVERALA
jgi:hypothetical protein